MLLKIAFRNIMRNKRRSVITAITICAGLVLYIYADSMLSSMDNTSIEQMVYLTDGAIKLSTEAYHDEKKSLPLDYGIPNAGEIEKTMNNDPRVSGTTHRTAFVGSVYDYADEFPIMGIVVDKETDPTVFKLTNYMVEGTYFTKEGENEVLVGKGLADKLNLQTGSVLIVSARTRGDMETADTFTVAGILKTPNLGLNKNTVFLCYRDADVFLDTDGLATEVYVQVNWPRGMPYQEYAEKVDPVLATVKEKYPTIVPTGILETAKELLAISESKRKTSGLIYLVVILIAAVGIVNTVLMSVYERIREIGVLRALGFSGNEVLLMFSLEGVFIGMIGGIAAIIIGAGLNALLVTYGIDFASFGEEAMGGLPIATVLYGQWNIGTYVFVFIFAVVVSFLASLIPARKAATLQVTRALRFE